VGVPGAGSGIPGDLNGDGNPDLLWESTDGWVAAWLMNGTVQSTNLLLYPFAVAVGGWHIAGAGDFNGDRNTDVLWQSDAGYVAAWLMDGSMQTSNLLLYPYPVAVGGWRIAATGDIDGDGKCDILWQHPDGWVAIWLMDGISQRTNMLLDPRPVAAGGWHIVGTGDLNSDGRTDLIWQSDDGWVAAWLMDGLSQTSNTLLYPYAVALGGWQIVAIADMNGDANVDLIWQNTDGTLATWFMNGTSHAGTQLLTPSPMLDPAWRIVGPK
jgi:hypothetical protein